MRRVDPLERHPHLVRLAAVPRHGPGQRDLAILDPRPGDEDSEAAVVDVSAAPDLVDGADVGEHAGLVALEAGQLLFIEAAAEVRCDLALDRVVLAELHTAPAGAVGLD